MGDTHALMIGVDGLFRWQEGIPQCILVLVYFAFIGGFHFRKGLRWQDFWEMQHPRFTVLISNTNNPRLLWKAWIGTPNGCARNRN